MTMKVTGIGLLCAVVLAYGCTSDTVDTTKTAKKSDSNGQLEAPATPTGLTATARAGSIELSWQAAEGAGYYVLSRSTSSGSGYAEFGTAGTTTFVDGAIDEGIEYFYVVQAKNDAGASGYSNEASAVYLTPVDAPTGLTADAGDRRVELSWNPVPEAESYVIVRGASQNGARMQVGATEETSFVDESAANRMTHYYAVRAVSENGDVSADSNVVEARPYRYNGELCLAVPQTSDVMMFSADATGEVELSGMVDGKKFFSGNSDDSSLVLDPVTGSLFVSDWYTYNVVQVYDWGTDAPFTAPTRVISRAAAASSSDRLDRPAGTVIAHDHGELYVVDSFRDRIHVIELDAEGEVDAPTFEATGLINPVAVAYSETQQELYILNDYPAAIYVFSRSTPLSGSVTPVRIIEGDNTQMDSPMALVYNPDEDTILVASSDKKILTFDRAASGNAHPLRVVTTPYGLSGIDLREAEGEILASHRSGGVLGYSVGSSDSTGVTLTRDIDIDYDGSTVTYAIHASEEMQEIAVLVKDRIFMFDIDADGLTAPLRVIGNTLNGLVYPKSLSVDRANNRLHVADNINLMTFDLGETSPTLPVDVVVGYFSAAAVGPDGLFTGGTSDVKRFEEGVEGHTAINDSLFSDLTDIAYDPLADEVWAYEYGTLEVFDPLTLASKRSLQVTNTELNSPEGARIALDPIEGEVYVFRPDDLVVEVYDVGLGSNTPLRTFGWEVDTGEGEGGDGRKAPALVVGVPSGEPAIETPTTSAGLDFDPINREVAAALNGNVYIFGREAQGGATPLRQMTLDHLSVTYNLDVAFCR